MMTGPLAGLQGFYVVQRGHNSSRHSGGSVRRRSRSETDTEGKYQREQDSNRKEITKVGRE